MLLDKIRSVVLFLGFPSFVRQYVKREVPYRFRSYLNYALWEYKIGRELANYLKKIEFESGSYQLDIGCGLGGGTIAQAETGTAFVIGLDIEKERLKTAQNLAKEKFVNNVSFVLGDAHNLCFKSQSLGSVISICAFEHLKMPYLCLAEIKRVLKNTGSVYIWLSTFWGPTGGHLYVYLPFPWVHYLPKTVIKRLLVKAPKLGTLTPESVYNVFLETNRLSMSDFVQFAKASGLQIKRRHFTSLPIFKKVINYFTGRLHDFFIFGHSCLLTKSIARQRDNNAEI